MLFTQLFEDDFNKKKTNESLADEFMAIAKAKGMNPRLRGTPDEERARTDAMLKQRAADRAAAPKPQPVDAETRAHLQDQLKSLEAQFDPQYEYSDDYSFWKEQSNIAQQIDRIKAALSRGMSEGSLNEFVLPGGGGDNYGGDLHDILMAYISRNEPGLLADFGEDEIDSVVADMITMGMFDDIDPDNEEDLEDALDKIIDILNDDLPEQGVAEGRMAELDAEYQDYKKLSPREFFNMYKITKQAWFEKHKGFLKNVSEADKKKENEPETRDVALQRAITRAKADFPTAGSGLEALAKDFMRSQDQDQKSFDQIRQAERQQNQMLNKINQIDQEQEQEIKDLEQQNSGLSQRLQQLQSVNSELEKKLAAMSGRKVSKSAEPVATIEPATTSVGSKAAPPAKTKAKTKSAKSKATPSAMKSTAAQLAAPKQDPMAAMTQRIRQGDQSITDKITGQKSLAFEPSDNVLEPVEPQRQSDPKFAAARANASDVDPKYYQDIANKAKRDISTGRHAELARAGSDELLRQTQADQMAMREGDKEQKPERPEADYGPEYQDMVSRVKKLAGQGPRKTVWDPVKRVYKTVPVNNDTK